MHIIISKSEWTEHLLNILEKTGEPFDQKNVDWFWYHVVNCRRQNRWLC